MTSVSKPGSLAIAGDRKKGSSTRIVVAGLAMLIVLLSGTARNLAARRQPGTRSADLKISVRVYNHAGISAERLRFAEREAARIYAKAGVYLEWHECPVPARAETANSACAAPLAPSDLQLRIVNSVKLMRIPASGEASGFAFGDLALVQLEYLQELPTPTEHIRYLMLGRVIAHEFGHALLGAGHSSQGIMQARWDEEQFKLTAASEMVFTPDQERALRRAVKTRTDSKQGR